MCREEETESGGRGGIYGKSERFAVGPEKERGPERQHACGGRGVTYVGRCKFVG